MWIALWNGLDYGNCICIMDLYVMNDENNYDQLYNAIEKEKDCVLFLYLHDADQIFRERT